MENTAFGSFDPMGCGNFKYCTVKKFISAGFYISGLKGIVAPFPERPGYGKHKHK